MEYNSPSALEHLLVAKLNQLGVLEDIICEYAIDNLRVCGHCGKLIQEGWMYAAFETYCSDACLLAEHPEADLEELLRQVTEDDSDTYWTAWEG